MTMGDTVGAGPYTIEMTEEEEGALAALQVGYNNLVSGMEAENVQDAINELMAGKISNDEKGAPGGVAQLGEDGLVLPSQVRPGGGFTEFSGTLTDREPNTLYGLILADFGGDS